ncbi:ribosomal protein S7 domain-containing protein [Aspergillus crustosus]
MPPRLNLFAASTALRQSAAPSSRRTLATRLSQPSKLTSQSPIGVQRRWNSSESDASEKKKLEEEKHAAEPLPHVSEEAAEINKIMGKDKEKRCDGTPASPELEQGTPVSEILSRDEEARKHAPKVFQNQVKKGPASSRSFSTSARRGQLENQDQPPSEAEAKASADLVASMISQATQRGAERLQVEEPLDPNLKFPAPKSLPKTENYRTRYEPIVDQFTKLIMRDGKLALAQKNMSYILDHLRSSPPPQIAPRRPLLPGPPPPQLPLNPIAYLALVIDSVAPLIKIKQLKGVAGGGASLQVPYPLPERERRRSAIKWIIDASDKRKDSQFAVRVASELVAVAEGRSGIWEKREALHKLGVAGRVNLGFQKFSRRKVN